MLCMAKRAGLGADGACRAGEGRLGQCLWYVYGEVMDGGRVARRPAGSPGDIGEGLRRQDARYSRQFAPLSFAM